MAPSKTITESRPTIKNSEKVEKKDIINRQNIKKENNSNIERRNSFQRAASASVPLLTAAACMCTASTASPNRFYAVFTYIFQFLCTFEALIFLCFSSIIVILFRGDLKETKSERGNAEWINNFDKLCTDGEVTPNTAEMSVSNFVEAQEDSSARRRAQYAAYGAFNRTFNNVKSFKAEKKE
eukprot:GHVL01014719.1.p1 GENE.GHVL01014719.1~~GHVL01014719.1.p1  ORF type:complete len:182 (+),score=38.09 GHVL01014719.1:95-640(+)